MYVDVHVCTVCIYVCMYVLFVCMIYLLYLSIDVFIYSLYKDGWMDALCMYCKFLCLSICLSSLTLFVSPCGLLFFLFPSLLLAESRNGSQAPQVPPPVGVC